MLGGPPKRSQRTDSTRLLVTVDLVSVLKKGRIVVNTVDGLVLLVDFGELVCFEVKRGMTDDEISKRCRR
jgi:hypothetical protein